MGFCGCDFISWVFFGSVSYFCIYYLEVFVLVVFLVILDVDEVLYLLFFIIDSKELYENNLGYI